MQRKATDFKSLQGPCHACYTGKTIPNRARPQTLCNMLIYCSPLEKVKLQPALSLAQVHSALTKLAMYVHV